VYLSAKRNVLSIYMYPLVRYRLTSARARSMPYSYSVIEPGTVRAINPIFDALLSTIKEAERAGLLPSPVKEKTDEC
jgi:hypothetical protein